VSRLLVGPGGASGAVALVNLLGCICIGGLAVKLS